MGQISSSQDNNSYSNNNDTSWTEISYETQVKKKTLQNIRNALRYETNAKIIQNGLQGYLVRKKINRLRDSSEIICSYLKSYQIRGNIKMITLMLDIINKRKQIEEYKHLQANIIKSFLKGFYDRSKAKKYIKAYAMHQESKSILHYRENIKNNLRSILFDWKRQIVWQKCMKEMQFPTIKNEITLSNNYITDGYKLMYRYFDNWYDSINWTKYYTVNYYYNKSMLQYGFRAFKNYIPDRVIRSKKNKRLKYKLADTIYKYNLFYKTLNKWKDITF